MTVLGVNSESVILRSDTSIILYACARMQNARVCMLLCYSQCTNAVFVLTVCVCVLCSVCLVTCLES